MLSIPDGGVVVTRRKAGMSRRSILRKFKLAAAASLAVHAAALSALAWAVLPYQPLKTLMVNAPFAGQQVAISMSLARPEIQVPPLPERTPTESPLLVTPETATHAEQVYVDKTSAETTASTTAIPLVEVSDLVSPDRPQAERESTGDVKPPAVTSGMPPALARAQRVMEPSTASVSVPPQTVGVSERRPARMQNNRPPRYPDIARQNQWQGTVLLKLTIDDAGRVTAVEVARSSGYSVLDAAAVSAVRQWQGEPALHDGIAVESEEYLPVRFRLQ